jgi:Meiotically up-regulated gene 113
MSPRTTSLYWVHTSDHDEDWFILAASRKAAADCFANAEGYSPGDATAVFLELLPERENFVEGYATYDLVKRLGYRKTTKNRLSLYRKKGKTFLQGSVAYRVFVRSVRQLSGIYVLQATGSRLFKIGKTRHIERRLNALQTGSGAKLQLRLFAACDRPHRLERILHETFERSHHYQEWF